MDDRQDMLFDNEEWEVVDHTGLDSDIDAVASLELAKFYERNPRLALLHGKGPEAPAPPPRKLVPIVTGIVSTFDSNPAA